jgi:hypothetical protein
MRGRGRSKYRPQRFLHCRDDFRQIGKVKYAHPICQRHARARLSGSRYLAVVFVRKEQPRPASSRSHNKRLGVMIIALLERRRMIVPKMDLAMRAEALTIVDVNQTTSVPARASRNVWSDERSFPGLLLVR